MLDRTWMLSSGMSIESALKSVDACCVHYILWEVIPGVYHINNIMHYFTCKFGQIRH